MLVIVLLMLVIILEYRQPCNFPELDSLLYPVN
jgi:hypothetical protein